MAIFRDISQKIALRNPNTAVVRCCRRTMDGVVFLIAESVAILLICFVLLVAILRSKNRSSAAIVLPIAVIPAAHLFFKFLLFFAKTGTLFGFRAGMWLAFVDIIALGVTCGIVVGLSTRIKVKKMRRAYLAVMVGYSALLCWGYVFNTLQPFLRQ